MKSPSLATLLLAILLAAPQLPAGEEFVTLSNTPMGTRERPLVLRTFLPDPGLGREVMANHGLGARARRYSPGKGDVEGFVDPIPGIPAAIAVSFGPELSICWDATECRLLYAWRGGFLDMTSYWGEPESGRRAAFDYVPRLVGELVYLARGSHPLAVYETYTEDLKPRFLSYRLVDEVPEFAYRLGEAVVRVRIEPGEEPLSITKHYTLERVEGWGYSEKGYDFETTGTGEGAFRVQIQGIPSGAAGPPPEVPRHSTEAPNAAWGEALHTTLGCFACHSTDGTRGHGPSFRGISNTLRPIVDAEPVLADEAYLAESITDPMAKIVESYPAGYMPPYVLEPDQIASLVLFIQSLANE